MSTATVPAVQKPAEIAFIPLGEKNEITLTVSRVRKFLCTPTKSGQYPSDEQVVKFMMLCKAQSLNPWVSDAFLLGYDTKDGPSFSLIVSHQSLLKRAEANDEFDGIESGVIVQKDSNVHERSGKVVFQGETLIGGWSRVHRKDRKISTYDSVQLATYNTNRSRWAADPAGMIVKVAEAAALRKTFPSNLSALYCQEEMENNHEPVDNLKSVSFEKPASRTEAAKARVAQRRDETPETIESEVVQDAPEEQSQDNVSQDEQNNLMSQYRDLEPNKDVRFAKYLEFGIDPNAGKWPSDGVAKMWDYLSELNEARKQ